MDSSGTLLEIVFGSAVYFATLLGCYDGDSCTIRFADTPALIATQKIRLAGIDTPELRGQCKAEIAMARQAQKLTTQHLTSAPVRYIGTDKYGRILVSAPHLNARLLKANVARLYDGKKRKPWC